MLPLMKYVNENSGPAQSQVACGAHFCLVVLDSKHQIEAL